MTLWLLLLAYMKHPLMKCTPHDVERRVDLFALQSASLKLSNIHLHSPPAFSFPCPSWGNCTCKPMSPTAFMNPTILRNLASEVSVGALMHDASSFMVYMRSGSGRLGWFGCAASCVGQAGRDGRDGFVVPHHVWYRLVGTVGWSGWCGYGCARGNLPKLESDPTIPTSTTRFRFYHSDLDNARFWTASGQK